MCVRYKFPILPVSDSQELVFCAAAEEAVGKFFLPCYEFITILKDHGVGTVLHSELKQE